MKLFKFLVGCVIFIVALGIVAAAYEKFNGGPWYTYMNSSGYRVIMGQDVRTTYKVYDESGKFIDSEPAWKFADEAPNSYVRDGNGELHLKDPVQLPQWMEITNAALQPFLKLGHFIVDGVVNFIMKMA